MLARRLLLPLVAALAAASATPALAAPPNDNIQSPVVVPGSSSPDYVKYSTAGATLQAQEPTSAGAPGHTLWFKWTPSGSGGAYADVCGAPYNHEVSVWHLPAGKALAFGNLVAADTGAGSNPEPSTFCRFRWTAAAGSAYYIQVDGPEQAGVPKVSEWSLLVNQGTTKPPAPKLEPWPSVVGPSFTAKWTLSGDATKSSCSLDGKALASCSGSGTQLTGMTQGQHLFIVSSRDGFGNSSTAVLKQFVVDATAPDTTASATAGGVTFGSPEGGATFECSVDGGAFGACTSPLSTAGLAPGTHAVAVRAKDAHGNADKTPATVSVTIAEPPVPVVPAQPATTPVLPVGTSTPRTETTATTTAAAPPVSGTTSSQTAAPSLRVDVRSRITRAVLRRGLSVRLTAGRQLPVSVEVRQGRRVLARGTKVLQAGRTTAVTLRARRVKTGTVTIVVRAAGTSTTRRVKVSS